MAKYLLQVDADASKMDSDLQKASAEILRVDTLLSLTITRMEKLEEKQRHLENSVETIYKRQDHVDDTLDEVVTDQAALTKGLRNIEEDIDAVKNEHKETKKVLTDKVDKLTDRVSTIERYRSLNRPDKVFFYPPDRLKYFLGRKEEIETLEERFLNSNEENVPSIQVICGLGGSGKTSLAVEYAWLTQNYYPGGIFWISAETNDILENSLTRLALDAETMGKDSKETLSLTLKWLGNLTSRWLLVVDNADQEELSNEVKDLLLGPWKRGSKGQLLVTTRREPEEAEETFKIDPDECVELGPMTPYESVDFILKRTGKTTSDESLEALVEELGGLPLAMEQAAAHIKILKCSFKDYLERFEKKRLKLFHKRSITTAYPVSKERLAVATTWQMNFDYICRQSEEEGLGNSVPFIMNISAFFFADDIPEELLNKGEPEIDNDDLKDAMEDVVGVKQVIAILTRFSLFQSCREGSFQVHRLVQEVIRDNISDVNYKADIIHAATKMLNSALKSATSPNDVLEVQHGSETLRGQLSFWSRLGMTSCTLRNHINSFVQKNGFENKLLWHFETLKVFQTSAIFHSIYQRQAEALSAQSEMLHMMSLCNVTVEQEKELTTVTIPVHDLERKTLQKCLESKIILDDSEQTIVVTDPNALREMGNKAFQGKREQDAIQFYTAGIKSSKVGETDTRLYTNRSLCFLKIQDFERALEDADSCIAIEPANWKAHCWRAYAIGHLIEIGKRPKAMEAAGLASASVAGFLNPKCKLEFKMKMFYPILVSRVVEDSKSLNDEFATLCNQPFTTLLLKKGRYDMGGFSAAKNIQVIGIDKEVDIFIQGELQIFPPIKEMLPAYLVPEKEIQVHFENIAFIKGGGEIVAHHGTTLIFSRCRFSNGGEACKDYPLCKGGGGCKNPDPNGCLSAFQTFGQTRGTGHFHTGIGGFPGLCVDSGGQIIIESCVLDGCGGGGALSVNKGSVLKVTNSIIQNNRQSGLEAREDGELYAVDNTIQNNQQHGILIGPYGKAVIRHNYIAGNVGEGIYCLEGRTENEMPEPIKADTKSMAVLEDNVISHNGLCGISMDGGAYIINGNKILENWCWGMMAKTRSSCHLTNNDIYNNKCGGIRIGFNYAAKLYLDGNTIRDHTGPHLYALDFPSTWKPYLKEAQNTDLPDMRSRLRRIGMPDDELTLYTSPPIVSSRNVFRHNDMKIQHPSAELVIPNVCSFCHKSGKNMKSCVSCRKAFYCSRECQKQHRKRHKHFCKMFNDKFTVTILMKNTKPSTEIKPGYVGIRMFDPSLKGIKQGPKPDRKSSNRFIVKIQSGQEYSKYDPQTEITLYDRSVDLDIRFRCPQLYLLTLECGILAANSYTTKKIFCWASFEKNGEILKVYTDNLPPFQTW